MQRSHSASTAGSSAAAERLNAVRGILGDVSAVIRSDLDRKGHDATEFYETTRDTLLRLEQHCATETRRRTEADTQLEQYIEERFGAVGAYINGSLDQRLEKLENNISAIQKRVGVLTTSLEEQRAAHEELMTSLRQAAAQSKQDVEHAIELQRSARMEVEVQMIDRIKREVAKFSERLLLETQMRERLRFTLHDELARIAEFSGKAEQDEVRRNLVIEVKWIADALVQQRAAREASTAALTDTMNAMVVQVNNGLRALTRVAK